WSRIDPQSKLFHAIDCHGAGPRELTGHPLLKRDRTVLLRRRNFKDCDMMTVAKRPRRPLLDAIILRPASPDSTSPPVPTMPRRNRWPRRPLALLFPQSRFL